MATASTSAHARLANAATNGLRGVTSAAGGLMPIRRFTVAEYQRMIDEGYFAADEAYELLDGLIVHKIARDPFHDASLAHAHRTLNAWLQPGWHVRVQSAVVALDSQPEPDLAIARGTEFDYLARHPSASDVALVVEVANTSLADDRAWKGPIYARAGFPIYWILNLNDSRVEVYSDPFGTDSAAVYRRRVDFLIGDAAPFILGESALGSIPIVELLPPISG